MAGTGAVSQFHGNFLSWSGRSAAQRSDQLIAGFFPGRRPAVHIGTVIELPWSACLRAAITSVVGRPVSRADCGQHHRMGRGTDMASHAVAAHSADCRCHPATRSQMPLAIGWKRPPTRWIAASHGVGCADARRAGSRARCRRWRPMHTGSMSGKTLPLTSTPFISPPLRLGRGAGLEQIASAPVRYRGPGAGLGWLSLLGRIDDHATPLHVAREMCSAHRSRRRSADPSPGYSGLERETASSGPGLIASKSVISVVEASAWKVHQSDCSGCRPPVSQGGNRRPSLPDLHQRAGNGAADGPLSGPVVPAVDGSRWFAGISILRVAASTFALSEAVRAAMPGCSGAYGVSLCLLLSEGCGQSAALTRLNIRGPERFPISWCPFFNGCVDARQTDALLSR